MTTKLFREEKEFANRLWSQQRGGEITMQPCQDTEKTVRTEFKYMKEFPRLRAEEIEK